MADPALEWLTAAEAARLIREGTVTSEQVVEACLGQVRDLEPTVRAWAFLDPDHALAQARAADEWRSLGRPLGPLHGVPVGVKDIFDTADMPTERGTALCAGRAPSRDASAVAMLRAAGALVMGKTATSELASVSPAPTRNPHDPTRTPGGSSSGSAAAVAAGMVPAAIGSQTGVSTILPASFCGVYGFKPTHGLIPRHGMLRLSRTLDHVGVFARGIDDLALLMESLVGHDDRDPDSRPRARPPYRTVAAEEPPVTPMLAFAKTSHWPQVAPDARAAFEELVAHLGDRIEPLELSPAAEEAAKGHWLVMVTEMAASLAREWEAGREQLSAPLRDRIARGRDARAVDYLLALERVPALEAAFTELFEQRYDAILTPAAAGTAPVGDDWASGPAFTALWTLCGMPALSIPLMQGDDGLPLGVQLVGPRHGDGRLLRTARWLVERVAGG